MADISTPTVAKATAAALASIFKKHPAVEKFQNEFIQALVDWIRPLFLKDDTPLEDLKKAPDVAVNISDVATKIEKHLNNNPNEVVLLQDLLNKLEDSGALGKESITANVTGDNNQIIQGVTNSSISINKN